MRWEIGAVEAVWIIVFVGFSVDYTLHVAHAFVSSRNATAESQVHEAVSHLGPSIFGAALTTCVAAVSLMLCTIQVFVKMGLVLFMSTLLSALFAFIALPALLLAVRELFLTPPLLPVAVRQPRAQLLVLQHQGLVLLHQLAP